MIVDLRPYSDASIDFWVEDLDSDEYSDSDNPQPPTARRQGRNRVGTRLEEYGTKVEPADEDGPRDTVCYIPSTLGKQFRVGYQITGTLKHRFEIQLALDGEYIPTQRMVEVGDNHAHTIEVAQRTRTTGLTFEFGGLGYYKVARLLTDIATTWAQSV